MKMCTRKGEREDIEGRRTAFMDKGGVLRGGCYMNKGVSWLRGGLAGRRSMVPKLFKPQANIKSARILCNSAKM